jgi:hypothetical protein
MKELEKKEQLNPKLAEENDIDRTEMTEIE